MVTGETPDPRDPFEGLQLDEAFIQGATLSELPASVRIERLQRIDQAHRQLGGDRGEQHRALYRTEQRRRRRKWLTILSILVLVGAAVSWSAVRSRAGQVSQSINQLAPGLIINDGSSSAVKGLANGQPSPSAEEQPHPIGSPPSAPAETGPFKFLGTQPNGHTKPVAYDPCRPVHIVVNGRTAPPGGDLALQGAIARLSAATGLDFIVDGSTTENASDHREPFQPDRYGDRWAPVLVAWTDPAESPDLAGTVTGEAGSQHLELNRGAVYVTGLVRLDGPELAEVSAGPGGEANVEAVIEHELGHLVGLDHVDDPNELMYPTTDGHVTDYATGDLLGLRQLGQGACFPDV
jgi:Matrixin